MVSGRPKQKNCHDFLPLKNSHIFNFEKSLILGKSNSESEPLSGSTSIDMASEARNNSAPDAGGETSPPSVDLVCLEGNIGAGKSTLSHQLSRLGYNVAQESVDVKDSLFQRALRQGTVFELQVAALIDLRNRRTALSSSAATSSSGSATCVMERGSVGAAAFIRAAALLGTITTLQQDLCLSMVTKTGGKSDTFRSGELTIYLDTPLDLCLARIRSRNRRGEENITLDYLQTVDTCYRDEINAARNHMPVVIVRVEPHWTVECTTAAVLETMRAVGAGTHPSAPSAKTI